MTTLVPAVFAVNLAGFQLTDAEWEYWEGAEWISYPFRGMFDPMAPEGNACDYIGPDNGIMVITVMLPDALSYAMWENMNRVFLTDVEVMVARCRAEVQADADGA